jgi:hypothetical protein
MNRNKFLKGILNELPNFINLIAFDNPDLLSDNISFSYQGTLNGIPSLIKYRHSVVSGYSGSYSSGILSVNDYSISLGWRQRRKLNAILTYYKYGGKVNLDKYGLIKSYDDVEFQLKCNKYFS